MYCLKCGKQIPDESVFCLFCGEKIHKEKSINEPLNQQFPVDLSNISISWSGGMEEVGRGKIARKLGIFFQLKDENGKETSYGGVVDIKLEWDQGYNSVGSFGSGGSVTESKGNINKRFTVRSDQDYFRSESKDYFGQIWCSYYYEPIVIKSSNNLVSIKIELWFLPDGSKKKLYRVVNKYLEPN
jgi:hypothetical protein